MGLLVFDLTELAALSWIFVDVWRFPLRFFFKEFPSLFDDFFLKLFPRWNELIRRIDLFVCGASAGVRF